MATNINYDGVPTGEDMQATLLPEPNEMYQFRNAFRVDNEATNRQGDSVEYPSLADDFEGEMVEVKKGDEYHEAKLDYDGLRAAWTKYGFEFRLYDEDIKDSKVNLVAINQREMTREEVRNLDGIAYSVIDANRNSTVIGTDGTDFNYSGAVAAYTTLVDAGYSAGRFVWFMGPDAWGDIAEMTEFTTDTETFAGELRGDGINLGEFMGRPAMLTNTGDLGDDEAFLIDTGAYGWESPRDPFAVSRRRDDATDSFVYKLSGRMDWVPTDPDAALKIQGGA